MNRELLVSGFCGRGKDRAARHHRDQVRAVFGAAVKVAVQSVRGNTPSDPAPVTATRTSDGRLATNTPTSA
jgi:hypothetical protein